MFIKYDDLVVVALTRKNANANLIFAFLYELVDVRAEKKGVDFAPIDILFQKKKKSTYFNGSFNEQALRSNFVLVYELLDEVMDHGYPQIVSVDLLKQYIHQGSAKEVPSSRNNAVDEIRDARDVTSTITGANNWRPEGKFMYQTNEVYLDVIEDVHVIVNQQGKELSAYCNGKIAMKSSLSGMPVCRFGLNDKVAMQKRKEARGSKKKVDNGSGIDLQDVTFHKSVRLTRYDQDKTIMFTPPDGEFELMTYRINKITLPFMVQKEIHERGRNRVEYNITIKSKFETAYQANDVRVIVPVPSHTSSVNIKTTTGKWEYKPTKASVVWQISRLAGGASATFRGEVKLAHLIQDKAWQRPPIELKFSIPMWPASGIKVRFLNVHEQKLQYKSIKWVRYVTNGGDYQIRI
ncbi:hypothetical protein RFI_07982 [Reticulomyxa filosa]|uniref:MHD domain-containing protein n=1 Tax=Reticulomyxa filosa TaxID=46433 RepID=X6NTP9_RETFI|nr:hypothetical protein RFI_07982 [Reticulomyxa filosa]|eukprot:ETO29144.1 hypothetical protein RFI_07982 [Reticulomyxa filosa]